MICPKCNLDHEPVCRITINDALKEYKIYQTDYSKRLMNKNLGIPNAPLEHNYFIKNLQKINNDIETLIKTIELDQEEIAGKK